MKKIVAIAVLMMVGLFVTGPVLIWLIYLGGLWLGRVLSCLPGRWS